MVLSHDGSGLCCVHGWHTGTWLTLHALCACRRPTSQQITGRMMNVARQEGLAVNEASMKALVEVHVASLQFGVLLSM